mgnify:CR=1 FL=1
MVSPRAALLASGVAGCRGVSVWANRRARLATRVCSAVAALQPARKRHDCGYGRTDCEDQCRSCGLV